MSTTTRTYHSSHELSITGFSHRQKDSYISLFRRIFCQSPWFESWSVYEVNRNLSNTMKHRSFLGFTAFLKNMPIGFITGYCLFDRFTLKCPFFIDQLFVDDRYQNMGVGKALIDELMKQLQENKCLIILLLTQENSHVEHFYIKYGFKRLQTVFHVRGKVLLYYTQNVRKGGIF